MRRQRTTRLHGQDARNWLAQQRAENEELKKMAGAARKSKLSKYEVTIKREVEYTAVVELEARNADEAKDIAEANADAAGANYWREGDVVSQTAKVKVLRGG
jgi:hypothetical protein